VPPPGSVTRRPDRPRARFERALRALARDRRSSSTTIGLRAIDEVESYLGRAPPDDLDAAIRGIQRRLAVLRSWQPSLTIVHAVVRSMDASLARVGRDRSPAGLRSDLRRRLRRLREGVLRARAAVARNSRPLFPRRRSVVTLSYSTEVREALLAAHRRRRLASVLVGVAGPRCEGHRLVRDLRTVGVDARPVSLGSLDDAVRRADLALIGADSLDADGSVVSKAGTCSLAEACRAMGKPFYPTASIAKVAAPQPRERARVGRVRAAAAAGPPVRLAPLFDRTPSRWVTRYVTDRGLLTARTLARWTRRARPGTRVARRPVATRPARRRCGAGGLARSPRPGRR
jgi:translation initiation factor 2B subunit (eIF-2B alpha/beta/delta family)